MATENSWLRGRIAVSAATLLASAALLGGAAALEPAAALADEAQQAPASQTLTTYPADQATPAGCVTVGVEGTYLSSEAYALLDSINALRAEAAAQGIQFEGETVAGTPLVWSDSLAYMAQIRAAEGAFAQAALGHDRPSGLGVIYGISAGNNFGVNCNDENIGWSTAAGQQVLSLIHI